MSFTNKLIESIAENFIAVMTEILDHASEYGDTDTLEAVADVLRVSGYVVVEDYSPDGKKLQAASRLLAGCERALSYLTNANSYEPEEVVSEIIDAMVLTGADRDALEECAKATWHPFPTQAKEPSRCES